MWKITENTVPFHEPICLHSPPNWTSGDKKKFFLLFLGSDFTRAQVTKGRKTGTGGMERGVAEGRRLPGQRPHAPVPRQHLRNHCPPHRHPSAAASRAGSPTCSSPRRTWPDTGIVCSLQRPWKTRRHGREKREKEEKERRKGKKSNWEAVRSFGTIGFPIDLSI